MYKKTYGPKTRITLNQSVEGEPIEQKIERIVNNKEPIKDGAPLIYTDRKDGIKASTNIRTDRWEVALDATDKIQGSYQARREERALKLIKNENKIENGGAESIQAE